MVQIFIMNQLPIYLLCSLHMHKTYRVRLVASLRAQDLWNEQFVHTQLGQTRTRAISAKISGLGFPE
jgi:hypothetical protein